MYHFSGGGKGSITLGLIFLPAATCYQLAIDTAHDNTRSILFNKCQWCEAPITNQDMTYSGENAGDLVAAVQAWVQLSGAMNKISYHLVLVKEWELRLSCRSSGLHDALCRSPTSQLPSRNPFRFAINAFHAASHDSPSCPGVCCSPSIGLRDWEMRRGSARSIRNAMSTIYTALRCHIVSCFPSSLIDWKAIWKLPTLLPGDEVDDRGLHKHGAKVLPHDRTRSNQETPHHPRSPNHNSNNP